MRGRWLAVIVGINMLLALHFATRVPEPAPSPHFSERLLLLSEARARHITTAEGARLSAVSADLPGARCYAVDDIDSMLDAAGLVRDLRAASVAARMSTSERSGPMYYLVYVEVPAGNAVAMVNEMRERGLKAFTMGESPRAQMGGIQLGLFQVRENAESHSIRLRDMGYEAHIARRFDRRYRVDIGPLDGPGDLDAMRRLTDSAAVAPCL